MTQTTKAVHADTEDKGRGYWKGGKWCQSAATKKANKSAIRQTRVRYATGREQVCDE